MGKPTPVWKSLEGGVLGTSWLSLALFVALVLSVSLYGLTASGHFPGEHRADALRTTFGAALLWGTMAASAAAAIYAVAFAAASLPWHLAIIGGGGALLIAPLILQPMSDRFVNGRRGLVTFAALAVLLAGLAWMSA
ncbi:MAG TPA: hypothetical protein VG966_05850 [Hyphomicrobiaceae bacterium]|nr:hypothetical protein [Hyphomicrobiaceae bacterium]